MATNFYVKSKDGTLVQTKDPSMGTEFYVKSNDGTPVKAKYLETNGKYIHDAKGKPYVVPDDFNWNTYMKEFEKRGKSLAADELERSHKPMRQCLNLGGRSAICVTSSTLAAQATSKGCMVIFFLLLRLPQAFSTGRCPLPQTLNNGLPWQVEARRTFFPGIAASTPTCQAHPGLRIAFPLTKARSTYQANTGTLRKTFPISKTAGISIRMAFMGLPTRPKDKRSLVNRRINLRADPARTQKHRSGCRPRPVPVDRQVPDDPGRNITPPGLPKTPAPNRLEHPSFLDPFWTSSPSFTPSLSSSQSRNPSPLHSRYSSSLMRSHTPRYGRLKQARLPRRRGKPFYSLKDKLDFIRRVYPSCQESLR